MLEQGWIKQLILIIFSNISLFLLTVSVNADVDQGYHLLAEGKLCLARDELEYCVEFYQGQWISEIHNNLKEEYGYKLGYSHLLLARSYQLLEEETPSIYHYNCAIHYFNQLGGNYSQEISLAQNHIRELINPSTVNTQITPSSLSNSPDESTNLLQRETTSSDNHAVSIVNRSYPDHHNSEGLSLALAARGYFQDGDYPTAILYFKQAIHSNPQDFNSYLDLAQSQKNIHDYDAALQTIHTIIENFPDARELVWVYYLGAQIYTMNGNPNQAIEFLNKILIRDPEMIWTIQEDPQFYSLNNLPAFHHLIQEIE